MRCFLAALLIFAGAVLTAPGMCAQDGGFTFARASNGIIAVAVEKTSGQFRIESAQGLPLMFSSSGGLTAYTNVKYGSRVYTTNSWNRTALPDGSTALPIRSIEELPDRVRLHSVMRDGPDSLSLQLDFIPSLDGDFAYVDVVAHFHNHGRRPVDVGLLQLYDIMLSTDDNAVCLADQQPVVRETAWTGGSVPRLVEASAPSSPYRVRLRLGAQFATLPDALVLGNWQFHGYLGTVVWDYQPSGKPITDLAALLRWDARPLGRGEDRRIGAEYGFLVLTDIDLTCSTSGLRVNDDSSAYIPQPMPVQAEVINTGVIPLQNVELTINFAAPLALSAGESAKKVVPGTLAPGGKAVVTWLFDVNGVDTVTSVPVDIAITSPDTLTRTCHLDIEIPPLRPSLVSIDCGDTIRLGISPDGAGYVPDPLALRVIVRNSGQRNANLLTATLQLPPELVLVSGTPTMNVSPDPLLPGQATSVIWPVRGIAQSTDRIVACTVSIFSGTALLSQCVTMVHIPGISSAPCLEPRVTTAGTEFYLAFMPDSIGTGQELLRMFVTAPQGAEVMVERLSDSRFTTMSIPAGSMQMLELDTRLNDIAPEAVSRTGIRITSDRPVYVFGGNFRDRHSDGFAVLPAHALGKEYYTVGYNWEGPYEQFMVLATEDGTTATIIPRAITSTDRPDGQPITVPLNRGDVYCIKSRFAGEGGSLTGSLVTADKPVAVFSGGESGWIPGVATPTTGFLNPHAEQMIPVEFLGTEYAAMPFRSRSGGDTYKIVATQPSTTVDTLGSTIFLQNPGDWQEVNLTTARKLTADKPILVAQFSNSARWDTDSSEYGDGSMLLLVPLDRHFSCHYFPAGMLLADPVIEPDPAVFLDVDDSLTIPDTPTTALRSFTFEAWVQSMTPGSIAARLDASATGSGWMLRFDGSRNRLLLTVADGTQRRDFASADNLLFWRQWAHLAVSVDMDLGSARVFKNGVEVIQAVFPPMSISSSTLTLGGNASGDAWTGYFDECRLWRGMLADSDILARHARKLRPLEMAAVAGYWSFCNGWLDDSGFGNDISPASGASLIAAWDLPAELRCLEPADSNFVNIVAPENATGDVRVNHRQIDAGEWSDLPGGAGWRTAAVHLPSGMNRLETSDARGIGAFSYGFAYHDAYTAFTGFGAWRTVAGIEAVGIPGEIMLHAPWPNPAVATDVYTAISLPNGARVSLRLYDGAGRMLRVLLDAECPLGTTSLRIPTEGLSSGMYRLELRYGQKNLVRVFVLHS